MSFNMLATEKIQSITLDNGDRPNAVKVSAVTISYVNGRYSKLGFIAVQSNGKIEAYKTPGYDKDAYWSKMDSTSYDLMSGSIIYSI